MRLFSILPTADIPYEDFGYLPGVAQAAQLLPLPDPHLTPQPVFNTRQMAEANWYTNRVHLSPLGSALK